MKFEAEAEVGPLAAAADRARTIVPSRNTIPIVEMARLRFVGEGLLEIGATDLDQAFAITVEAKGEGAICVPASDLAAALKRLDKGPLVKMALGDDGMRLTIKQGRTRFVLPVLPAIDWPELSAAKAPKTWALPSATLARALGGVMNAASTDETRYYLHGIFLDTAKRGEDPVVMVATDGHRLAREPLAALPDDLQGLPGVIIPIGACTPILDLCRLGEMVTLELSEVMIGARVGGVHYRSKLIDATFPDYTRVIPYYDDAISFKVDAAKLGRMIERCGVAPADKAVNKRDGVTKSWMIKTGTELTLKAAGDGREVEDVTETSDAIGGDLSVGFNLKYVGWVVDSLEGAKAIQLTFSDKGGNGPVIIRDPAADALAVRVLMPLRV